MPSKITKKTQWRGRIPEKLKISLKKVGDIYKNKIKEERARGERKEPKKKTSCNYKPLLLCFSTILLQISTNCTHINKNTYIKPGLLIPS